MPWNPIANTVPQYEDVNGQPASGFVLKAYAAGTSTNISLATDNTGSSVASSVALNASGYPEVSGNIIIPHVEQDYKLALYPTQTAADSDTGAIWTIDNIETTGAASNEWQASGITPTRTTDTTFTLSGDQTAEFHIGRRLRTTDSGGTDYHTITASSYSDPLTTVTVATDGGGALDAGLSAVDLSILSGNNSAVPALYKVVAQNSSIGTDVITLSVDPSVQAYVQGLEITFKAGGTNTGAATININSAGAKSIKLKHGNELRSNDIESGKMYTIVYDGTDFILSATQSESYTGNGLAAHKNLAVVYAGVSTVDIDADEVILTANNSVFKATSVNLTVDITASGANGLDTGSEASSTWYYIYVIYNGTTVASLISTSATSPTLPSGYTFSGLVGAVYNNSSSDLLGFHQINNEVELIVPETDVNSSANSTSGISVTLSCPPNVLARVNVRGSASGSAEVLVTSLNQANTAPTGTLFTHFLTSTINYSVEIQRMTDASSQIRYRSNLASTTTIIMNTQGWTWV